MTNVRVEADLAFEVVPPGRAASDPVTGRIRGDGRTVRIELSEVPSVRGASTRIGRLMPRWLADHGLRVEVIGPSGLLLSAGRDVSSPWWLRPLVGGQPLRLGRLGPLLRSATGPRLADVALPTGLADWLPIMDRRSEQLAWRRRIPRHVGRLIADVRARRLRP